METIDPCRLLVAMARLLDNGNVVYSQEGTPIRERELTLDQLRTQLKCNGAFSENIEKFVSTLQATGFAEIRQPKLVTPILRCLALSAHLFPASQDRGHDTRASTPVDHRDNP